jgi:hypothetical protein
MRQQMIASCQIAGCGRGGMGDTGFLPTREDNCVTACRDPLSCRRKLSDVEEACPLGDDPPYAPMQLPSVSRRTASYSPIGLPKKLHYCRCPEASPSKASVSNAV